jgi:hypothetical protein
MRFRMRAFRAAPRSAYPRAALAAPDRQVALQVMPGGRRGGLGQINLVAWFPKEDCCAARRRSVIPGPEAREYLQCLATHFA